jgi:hypothetical protein
MKERLKRIIIKKRKKELKLMFKLGKSTMENNYCTIDEKLGREID